MPRSLNRGLHVDADGFVVAVDLGPALGWPAASWCADSADEGGDDLVAGGEQRGDDTRGIAVDRLEARDAFAFGVALQRQQSEADLEDG
jgi:hypothetical protein